MVFTVVVTGSRHLEDEQKVFDYLSDLKAELGYEPLFVRHGDCPTGADRFASIWCSDFYGPEDGVYEIKHPADWDNCTSNCLPGHRRRKQPGDTVYPGLLETYCPKAGPRRNREMAQAGADLCLAFPLGKSYGTWNCVNECKKAGIPVKVIE
jgi:hypothetical protein